MILNLDEFLKNTSRDVNTELGKFFPKKMNRAWFVKAVGGLDFGYDSSGPQKAILDPIWDFLDRGGKRWRPALMVLACQSVGGKKKDALPFSVLPELTHNGTIMIDDIEDNSSLRRGKPSTHIIFGNDIAINAGNAMYYLPLMLLFRSKKIPAEVKAKIYDLYSEEMLRLSFGQAMDIYWHRGNSNDVTEGQYLQMCSFKTGSLARFSAKLGAVLGGGSEKQVEALGDFATSIGVAFQIQDDILNIKPATIEWGKEIGDDIKEGKRTLMVIRAMKILQKAKRERLVEILDLKEKTDSEVKEAISILEECGSIEYCRKAAENLVLRSWKKLDKKLPKSDAKVLLKEFADYLVERNI